MNSLFYGFIIRKSSNLMHKQCDRSIVMLLEWVKQQVIFLPLRQSSMPLPKRIIGVWRFSGRSRKIELRYSIFSDPFLSQARIRVAHTFLLSPFRGIRICDARYIYRWKQRALHLEFVRARACTWLFSASKTKKIYRARCRACDKYSCLWQDASQNANMFHYSLSLNYEH